MKKNIIYLSIAIGLSFSGVSNAQEKAQNTISNVSMQQIGPQEYIQNMATVIFNDVKSHKDKDLKYVNSLVEKQIMPSVDFDKLLQNVLGKYNRVATDEQKKELAQEFKKLLIRTYANALLEINEQQLTFRPFRGNSQDNIAVIRSKVTGRGEPIDLDYRVEKQLDGSWKIIDLNILGVWLGENYKNQFSQVISQSSIDGLIKNLKERNSKV